MKMNLILSCWNDWIAKREKYEEGLKEAKKNEKLAPTLGWSWWFYIGCSASGGIGIMTI